LAQALLHLSNTLFIVCSNSEILTFFDGQLICMFKFNEEAKFITHKQAVQYPTAHIRQRAFYQTISTKMLRNTNSADFRADRTAVLHV
jgi:hypothetical protein